MLIRSRAPGCRSTAALLAALGLVLAGTVLTALVDPMPARADGCGPGRLGSATRWKDRNVIFDFASVCDWHDRCYGSRGFGFDPVRAPGRAVTAYPREWCDAGFREGMRRSCGTKPSGFAAAKLCRAAADLFYGLVRAFGEPWYRRADGRRSFAVLAWP